MPTAAARLQCEAIFLFEYLSSLAKEPRSGAVRGGGPMPAAPRESYRCARLHCESNFLFEYLSSLAKEPRSGGEPRSGAVSATICVSGQDRYSFSTSRSRPRTGQFT